MTYENFLKIILTQQKLDRQITAAYELKIDLIDFVDDYNKIISILIQEIYDEEGYDWYSWFCYENDYGQKDWSTTSSYKENEKGEIELEYKAGEVRHGAHDEEGNPICYSFESLWEYLENNHKAKPEKPKVKEEEIVEPLSLEDLMNLIMDDSKPLPYTYFKPKDEEVKYDSTKYDYLSIFEHQNQVAGRELGKKVATAAQKSGIRPVTKLVSTLKYQGPILTYPRSFLDNYFSTK
jgi:hypothetical protein